MSRSPRIIASCSRARRRARRTITATQLAKSLGYANHGGANLHNGTLADKVCQALGQPRPATRLNVLTRFDRPPKGAANGHLLLTLRPNVVAALRELGWSQTRRPSGPEARRHARHAPRFWTCHWEIRNWRPDINTEYESIDCSASNTLTKRGVSRGDFAYVISLAQGHLMLGGRFKVSRVEPYTRALTLLRTSNIYRRDEVCVAQPGTGTPLNLHRRLAPSVSRQIRFLSPDGGPKGLCFVSEAQLDRQATRGIRELTPESAALLDRIIDLTDRLPRTDKPITVT